MTSTSAATIIFARICDTLPRIYSLWYSRAILQSRQRPLGFRRRRHLHQGFAVEHDLVGDLADAGEPRALAVGNELGHLDRHLDGVADPHRRTEVERLRDIDRPRTRQAGAEHRR